MPPRSAAPKTPRSPAAVQLAQEQKAEDELLGKLAEKQLQLTSAQDQVERLTSVRAALDGERYTLGARLTEERTQFGDITGYLKHALEEQTQRAEGLERQAADTAAQLQAAQQAAAADVAAAEQRLAAVVASKQAEMDAQRGRMQEAEAFLTERDSLRATLVSLQAQLEEEKRQHHKRNMDLERKHASDREMWRRETAEAVRATREEMAALTDQRLDATTKQTIYENEAMAGELQYQGRHVQAILARNSTLQREASDLRVALSISRESEQELAKKALACEATIETLLERLQAVEAERETGAQAEARLHAQLLAAQQGGHQEARLAAGRVTELEHRLAATQQELERVTASLNDAANFLLACLADARQRLIAEQEQAALAAAGAAMLGGAQGWASCNSVGVGSSGKGETGQPTSSLPQQPSLRVHLAELPLQQREAVLQHLLEQLPGDWQSREGVVLGAPGLDCSAESNASSAGCMGATGGSMPLHSGSCDGMGSAARLYRGQLSMGAGSRASGRGLTCSGSSSVELMQQLCSEVRPWGGRADKRAAPRPAAAGGGKSPAWGVPSASGARHTVVK